MSKYLTKSLFMLGISCPTKIFYYANSLYEDQSSGDEFLRLLAEGGFQVGELAKVMFPGGVEIVERDLEEQAVRTREFLQSGDCTLFEGTVICGSWLARVDVIRRIGNSLEIVEVKSKPFDSRQGEAESFWRSARDGSIKKEFLPYLQDIAFQTMVMREAFPALEIRPSLMLPDKAAQSSVDNLHQLFRIRRHSMSDGTVRSRAEPIHGVTEASLGEPILKRIDVSTFVDQILSSDLEVPGAVKPFRELACDWADSKSTNRRISPVIGSHCRSCQFRSDTTSGSVRSGFHECWSTVLPNTDVTASSLIRPIVDLYHPIAGQIEGIIAEGIYTFHDVRDADLPEASNSLGLTRSQRQRMQVFGLPKPGELFYFDSASWSDLINTFSWPLNFIDFEGARSALPLYKGGRPYQQLAFQFSHHVMERDGTVRHASEFITLESGENPNVSFVSALHRSLSNPAVAGGTVFMWHHYERDVVRELKNQLVARRDEIGISNDLDQLIVFLDGLSQKSGPTAMVDLRVIADRLFFHPDTDGSSSIKVVLPAVMKCSPYLRERYSVPVYGAPKGIFSYNFPINPHDAGMVWWREGVAGVISPYDLLAAKSLSEPDSQQVFSLDDRPDIAEGGAAMAAYLRMQCADVTPAEREAARRALLRYCELDTLAMVMIYEAWREWSR